MFHVKQGGLYQARKTANPVLPLRPLKSAGAGLS